MKFTDITTDIELADIFTEGMTFDELEEAVQQWITEQDIVYYSVAIDLLKENDPSLNDSINLAVEMGYEANNLNSELLATLLHQDMLQNDWADIRDEVEELFESTNEDE